jgi:hypothetical protein
MKTILATIAILALSAAANAHPQTKVCTETLKFDHDQFQRLDDLAKYTAKRPEADAALSTLIHDLQDQMTDVCSQPTEQLAKQAFHRYDNRIAQDSSHLASTLKSGK